MIRLSRLALPLAVTAVLLASAFAQGTTGRISGVLKSDVAPVGGAVVTVDVGTKTLQTVTAADGSFTLLEVPPGSYKVKLTWEHDGTTSISTTSDVTVLAGSKTIIELPPFHTYRILEPGPGMKEPTVVIETPFGDINVELDRQHAPVTVGNFLKYIEARMYNGGRFYRVTRPDNYTPVLPDRPMMEIIQGGIDPSQSAKRFPAIPLERTSVTGLRHVTGTISMARGAADSATSEFFILLGDQPSLDFGGKRFPDGQGGAAFGHVVFGLDVVRKIQQQPAQGQNLTTPVKIISITRVK